MLKFLSLFLLTLCFTVQANKFPRDPDVVAYQEKWGIIEYQRGNYKEAFEKLSELAALGYKESQYALAFMFLKGQHVEQSTLIGMGWLGVASEAGYPEWVELFDKLYNASTKTDQARFDRIIKDYTTKFGMKAQKVSCRKRTRQQSRRVTLDCIKDDHYITQHDIDLVEPAY